MPSLLKFLVSGFIQARFGDTLNPNLNFCSSLPWALRLKTVIHKISVKRKFFIFLCSNDCDCMVSMPANFLKKVNTKNLFFLLALITMFLTSCKRNKHSVDTGNVKVEGVKVLRFE